MSIYKCFFSDSHNRRPSCLYPPEINRQSSANRHDCFLAHGPANFFARQHGVPFSLRRILRLPANYPPRQFNPCRPQTRVAMLADASLAMGVPAGIYTGTHSSHARHLPPVLKPVPVADFPPQHFAGQLAKLHRLRLGLLLQLECGGVQLLIDGQNQIARDRQHTDASFDIVRVIPSLLTAGNHGSRWSSTCSPAVPLEVRWITTPFGRVQFEFAAHRAQCERRAMIDEAFHSNALADGDKGEEKCCPILSKSGHGFDFSKQYDCRWPLRLGRVIVVAVHVCDCVDSK